MHSRIELLRIVRTSSATVSIEFLRHLLELKNES